MSLVVSQFQEQVYALLRKYWGYSSFRPFQEETISSILEGRDTLTILPTGGGKSLCFQLPALLKEGMAVVISPLIALMKDQVDGLKGIGIAADCLNSSRSIEEQRAIFQRIRKGELKLLYLAPERLKNPAALQWLNSIPISFFVIDEAHCISQWGHDFREEYRNLKVIKEKFQSVNVHAFTASATQEVQQDILDQLALDHPQVLIASVDRPNLTYRVIPRSHWVRQIADLLKKHMGEAGIIYCLRRDDVNELSDRLNELGFKNLPYHAGLSDEMRHLHQEEFVQEKVHLIIATVAFGMGIDRSNIRFVIHAAMPKSIEYYHQETGRAGRDGLPAYCYMLYGGRDYRTWSFLLEKSPNQGTMMDKLSRLYRFCTQPQCRHRVLANYFGQSYESSSCQACDYCLDEIDKVEQPLLISQKILSCVARVNQRFGIRHVANILKGHITEGVSRWGHQHLPTFGLMANASSLEEIRYLIEQLVGQGFLKKEGEYVTLSLTETGQQVLRGELTPTLAKPLIVSKKKEIEKRRHEKKEREWDGMDRELFQLLRQKRTDLAQQEKVPTYLIFGDLSLKDMASIKPVTRREFATVFGVGERKLQAYAEPFIEVIQRYARSRKK